MHVHAFSHILVNKNAFYILIIVHALTCILIHSDTFSHKRMHVHAFSYIFMNKQSCTCNLRHLYSFSDNLMLLQPTMTHPPLNMSLLHIFLFNLMHAHANHTFTYILPLNKEECVCRLKNGMDVGGGHVSPEATPLMFVSLQ